MTIVAGTEPTRALTTPSSSHEDEMSKLRADCGIVAGGIDSAIHAITGFSPLEEWVFTPLAGNWVQLDEGAGAWAAAGRAAQALKDNIAAVPGQLDERWQGNAAEGFCAAQATIVRELDELPSACAQMSEMTDAISEAARAVAELIAAVINEVVDFALEMLASLAVPVAGEAVMPAWIAKLAVRVARWSTRISRAITAFGRLVVKVIGLVARIKGVVVKVARLLRTLGGVTKAAERTGAAVRLAHVLPDAVTAVDAVGPARDTQREPVGGSSVGTW